MEQSEIRRLLLAQHAYLRKLMERLEQALTEKKGVESALGALREALAAHNEVEEAALLPILETVDAWGPERVKAMLVEHKEEHGLILELGQQLEETALRRMLLHLREHMAFEEKYLLGERVLRDDVISTEAD